MVVDMLSLNFGKYARGMSSLVSGAGVFELCSFALEFLTCLRGVTVIELCVLHGCHSVAVLLWKDFLVFNRLDGGMVVVLVDFAVYGFLDWEVMSN